MQHKTGRRERGRKKARNHSATLKDYSLATAISQLRATRTSRRRQRAAAGVLARHRSIAFSENGGQTKLVRAGMANWRRVDEDIWMRKNLDAGGTASPTEKGGGLWKTADIMGIASVKLKKLSWPERRRNVTRQEKTLSCQKEANRNHRRPRQRLKLRQWE